jgi:hypothetical protein
VVAVCRTGATNHFVFTPASFAYAAGTIQIQGIPDV